MEHFASEGSNARLALAINWKQRPVRMEKFNIYFCLTFSHVGKIKIHFPSLSSFEDTAAKVRCLHKLPVNLVFRISY